MLLITLWTLDKKFTVYSDLPGHTAPGGSSIPPDLCVTVQKPDIVFLNKHTKTIYLFELTCPLEKHIHTTHLEKVVTTHILLQPLPSTSVW